MRVAVVDTYYPAFLSDFYARNPELARAPYAARHDALMGEFFGTAGAIADALAEAGHVAAALVANDERLQAAWLHERKPLLRLAHAVTGGRPRRVFESPAGFQRALVDQIDELEADVVYALDVSWLSEASAAELRSQGRRLAGQIASPWPGDEVVCRYDLMVTSFPHFLERFRALGVEAVYMPLAFDAAAAGRLARDGIDSSPEGRRAHPVAFVGGVDPSVHGAGTDLLARLARETEIEIWGYGADRLPADSPIRERHRGEAWGLAMYRALADSQIVVNRHIEAAEGHANNMRLFEATGMGALLLTEEAPNLGDVFEPGAEVATYASPDELVEKIRWFGEHPDERVRVAAAGQARTLRDHTYARRAEQLADVLAERL